MAGAVLVEDGVMWWPASHGGLVALPYGGLEDFDMWWPASHDGLVALSCGGYL